MRINGARPWITPPGQHFNVNVKYACDNHLWALKRHSNLCLIMGAGEEHYQLIKSNPICNSPSAAADFKMRNCFLNVPTYEFLKHM